MVYVTRLDDWFLITNSDGGYGRFMLSADDESVWVYDVWGKNIAPDILDYCRELARRLGLMMKANIGNKALYRWLKIINRNDPDVVFDDSVNLITVRNQHG